MIKLSLKWIKSVKLTNMITVNSQRSSTLEIVENVQLKIIDALVSINIYIIDLAKEKLFIGLN